MLLNVADIINLEFQFVCEVPRCPGFLVKVHDGYLFHNITLDHRKSFKNFFFGKWFTWV